MTQNVQVSDVMYWINQIDNIEDVRYIIGKAQDRIPEIIKERQREMVAEYLKQPLFNMNSSQNIDTILDSMKNLHDSVFEVNDNWSDYYYNDLESRKFNAYDYAKTALQYIDTLNLLNVPLDFFIVTDEGKTTFECLLEEYIDLVKQF